MADLDDTALRCVTVEVSKLDVKPGETVVIRLDAILFSDVIDRLSGYAKAGLPDGVKVLVLDRRATLQVVRAADNEPA